MQILVQENYFQMSEMAAYLLIEEINKILSVKPRCIVIFSAGKTPELTYELLRSKYKNKVAWHKLIVFQMDDYLGLNSNHHQSFSYYLLNRLIRPLNIQEYYLLNNEMGTQAWEMETYEKLIEQQEGIDLIVHGIGINGHLGFNEPGSHFKSKARVVDLADSTIQANSTNFESINEVPQKAMTLGLDILSKAKKTFLLASGKEKHFAVRSSLFEPMTEKMPASILQMCSNVKIVLDREACGWHKNENLPLVSEEIYNAICLDERLINHKKRQVVISKSVIPS
ncbi:6-phosphogluconolactonase [Nostoc sp.]